MSARSGTLSALSGQQWDRIGQPCHSTSRTITSLLWGTENCFILDHRPKTTIQLLGPTHLSTHITGETKSVLCIQTYCLLVYLHVYYVVPTIELLYQYAFDCRLSLIIFPTTTRPQLVMHSDVMRPTKPSHSHCRKSGAVLRLVKTSTMQPP